VLPAREGIISDHQRRMPARVGTVQLLPVRPYSGPVRGTLRVERALSRDAH